METLLWPQGHASTVVVGGGLEGGCRVVDHSEVLVVRLKPTSNSQVGLFASDFCQPGPGVLHLQPIVACKATVCDYMQMSE